MRNYTTQMDAARKGIVTPEIEIVAKKENMTTEALTLGTISGIEMCFRNHQTGFAVSFFYFYQFYTCFIGKTVFLEKFLRRHVVW